MNTLLVVSILIMSIIALKALCKVKNETSVWLGMRRYNPKIRGCIDRGEKCFKHLNLKLIHNDMIRGASIIGMIATTINVIIAIAALVLEAGFSQQIGYIMFLLPLSIYALSVWSSVVLRCDIIRMSYNDTLTRN